MRGEPFVRPPGFKQRGADYFSAFPGGPANGQVRGAR